MKKVILSVLLGLVLIIAGLLGFAALQPAAWRLERSTTINAPRDVVWRLVSDFNRYQEWSPLAQLDPNMKTTVEGSGGTVGASYSWDGNDQAGAGKMTVTEAKPGESLAIELAFLRPWQTTNSVAYTLADEAGGTKMTWAMWGTHENVIGKGMGALFMDKMVGKDFETGLARVKEITEKEAASAENEEAHD